MGHCQFSLSALCQMVCLCICHDNETAGRENKGRTDRLLLCFCFVTVRAHIHETLSTVLLASDGLIKRVRLPKGQISAEHHTEWVGHGVLLLQLCQHISHTQFYSRHDQNWIWICTHITNVILTAGLSVMH